MKIIISFDADNDAFCDYPHGNGDFDSEIKRILKQAEDYLVGNRYSEKLIDTNGNTVGEVFRSSCIKPRKGRNDKGQTKNIPPV